MERFDKKGRLIIPDLQKLGAAKKVGVLVEKKKLHVTRAFCPKGHALITDSSRKFGGRPGIQLWVRGKHLEQLVTLSPFQGDFAKFYEQEFEAGEGLDVMCPLCYAPLPVLAPCGCTPGSYWVVMFLRPEHDYNDAVGVCNTWGCPSSFIRLSGEILTEYRASAQR